MRYLWFLALIVLATLPAFAADKSNRESALDRVTRTNVLRCGFQYWDGGLVRDEQTGVMKGLIVELTDKIAGIADLKIEWAGPIDWGNVRAELDSGKIDAMCAGMWQAGQKARYMIFSDPFAYQGMEAYVRADETRFDRNFNGLNDAGVKIAVVDNDNGFFVAQNSFAKAKLFSMPMGATDTDMLMAVMTGKADVTFTAPGIAYQFMQANPGKVKALSPGRYLRVFGNTYVVGAGEFQLAHFLQTVLAEVENSGYVDDLIDRYNKDYPLMFIKKAKPYEAEK